MVFCFLLLPSSAPADTLINFADFSSFAARWSQSGCSSANNWCGGFDYDISGTVDANDLVLFSDTWLTSKDRVLSDDIAKVFIDRGIPSGTNRWVYDNGFALISLYEKYQRCHNPVYLKYIKDWTDVMVNSSGTITDPCYKPTDYNLDMTLCGRTCLAMYNQFHEVKYKLAADNLINNQLGAAGQPRCADGGFWHKYMYPYQMWLDGLYMAEPFAAQYGLMFNNSQWSYEAADQLTIIASHTQDPSTGLLYHAWADIASINSHGLSNPKWANATTGRSPEFWGRGLGWYSMALVDCLDYLPANHPKRQQVITILRSLATGLAYYQDPATGMWWQVVNKGYPQATYPTNWVESSGTGMFSYAIGKAVEKGYLDDPNYYRNVSRAGYEGLVANKVSYDTYGYVKLVGIVGSTSPGTYSQYVNNGQAAANDFRGLAALMRAALQYEKMTPVTYP
jgi:unsaturated rhamnogalacturonyl hydrolase